jgi:protein phosphatase
LIKTFSLTDIGKKRESNQDYVYSSETPVGNLPNLFILADGMGGYNGGDLASQLAVETIVNSCRDSAEVLPRKIFDEAITLTNTVIREKAASLAELEGMGTTIVCATILEGNVLHIANVGDSRLYIVNEEFIRQITTDHSYVEEMIKVGSIDRESARNHPKKNIITRAIGADDYIVPDFFTVKLRPGDIILMCSDGLSNMIYDDEIMMIIKKEKDMVSKAESLIAAANNNGGLDNISVILVDAFA